MKSNSEKAQTEGAFYRTIDNNYVYWFCLGKYHHIQTEATLNGLFTNAGSYITNISSLDATRIGTELDPNNGLRPNN